MATGDRQRGRRRRRGRLVAACAGLAFAAATLAASLPAPRLSADTDLSREGYYQLSWVWEGAGAPVFVVQQAREPTFAQPVTLYRGRDTATFLSGQRDGRYHYRVRAVFDDGRRSPWSEPQRVVVDHYSLGQAFTFFGIGAVVFAATLALVVGGALRMRATGA